MTKNQKIVAIGSGSGVTFVLVSTYILYHIWPENIELIDMSDQMAYALRVNALAILPLLIGIITVGNNRFTTEAIDPLIQREDHKTIVNGHFVDNTAQQSLLFFIGTMAMSTVLNPDQMRIIPSVATVFVVARVAFWIGYRINPMYRAFGMGATGYLNLCILAFTTWKIISGT